MSSIWIIATFCAFMCPLIIAQNLQTHWIEQKLDNFDDKNTKKWNMRYMSNDQFYKKGGPIFIFFGGEWTITGSFILGGHFVDMAREHNAYLLYTEHRYYGDSQPNGDLEVKNMAYLNVRQALADIAHLVRTFKASNPDFQNAKVIIAGGSYSADMVTWFKQFYPELATGGWASSTTLIAIADMPEYMENVGKVIKQLGGEACYNRIASATKQLEAKINNKSGTEFKNLLKICSPFSQTNSLDVATAFYQISQHFGDLILNYDGKNVQNACKKILDNENDLTGYVNYLLVGLNVTTCIDLSYKKRIDDLQYRQVNGEQKFERQFTYQLCNEFGWFETSNSKNQPFGTKFPLNFFTTTCADLYGAKFTPQYIESQMSATNNALGAMNPKVENIFFTQGTIDPWGSYGIHDNNRGAVIPMATHVEDLASISATDSAEMRAAKEKLAKQVTAWLQ